MADDPGIPDERPQRRREYSGAASTLGAAALVILAVGVAIWYFEMGGGSRSASGEPGFGIVALPDEANSTDRAPAAEEGRAAPNFQLRTLDGDQNTLLDYRGQYVVLNFWASWCGPCQTETPFLQRFSETYADRGVVVVGVNQQETLAAARSFAEKFSVAYPLLLDTTGEVSDGYRVSSVTIPMTFLLDPDGVIVNVHRGPVLEGDLEAMLEGHVS